MEIIYQRLPEQEQAQEPQPHSSKRRFPEFIFFITHINSPLQFYRIIIMSLKDNFSMSDFVFLDFPFLKASTNGLETDCMAC